MWVWASTMGSAHSEHASSGVEVLVEVEPLSCVDPNPTSERYRLDTSLPVFTLFGRVAISEVSVLVDAGMNLTRLRFRPAPKGFWRRQSGTSSSERS